MGGSLWSRVESVLCIIKDARLPWRSERERERGKREKEREEQREREERNRRQAEEEEEEHGQCISIMRQARIRVLEWDAAASHAVANSATTSAKDSRTRSISSRYSISISKKRLRDAKTDRELRTEKRPCLSFFVFASHLRRSRMLRIIQRNLPLSLSWISRD